jgi:hypothetical protein
VPKSSQRRNETRKSNKDRRARLEELKRQQRAAERRKNFLFVGTAIVIALVLIGAAVVPAYLHDRAQNEKKKKAAAVLKAESKVGFVTTPTAAEQAAGCTGTHTDPLSPAAHHVTSPIDYTKEKFGDTSGGTPPIPPSGGAHNPVSLGQVSRFYPLADKPRPERAVHNLEHGFVVVWYDAKVAATQVDELHTLSTSLPRLLTVGWWQSELPSNKHVVLTAWGRTERCDTVSMDVVRAFAAKYTDLPSAPEKGLPAISGADNYPAGTLPGAAAPTPSPTASATPSSK